jgi:signal transduction histidine kinase
VLVLAPFGRDAAEICRVLREADLDATPCADAEALCREVERGAAAALLSEEALGDDARARIASTLAAQPSWSDFPVLVLGARHRRGGDGWQAVRGVEGTGYLSLLERPLQVATLVSAVRTAAHARARQYQVRDELDARARAEGALRALNETLEARVAERTREVRRLAARLTAAEQAERHRLAEVLHDDLQQRLYGASVFLNLLAESETEAERRELHAGIAEALSSTINLARSLSTELSPPVLASDGLAALLGWLAERKRALYGLAVEVEVEEPCVVPDRDVRVLLYRVLREALFNVVKHAGTRRARVHARREGDEVVVVVEDEGAGFDPQAAERSARTKDAGAGGFGLANVRERLGLIGGRLEVASAPGRGSTVTVVVPVHGGNP